MKIIVKNLIILSLITLSIDTNSAHVTIDLESDPQSDLFLEDINKSDSESSTRQTDIKYFALVHPFSSVSVRATYGPLTVRQTVFPSYWTDIEHNPKKNESFIGNITNIESEPNVWALNGEISAHLVTKEIRKSNPVLRVLFHVGHTSDYHQRSRMDFIDKTLCAAIVVQYNREKLFGTCSPSRSREGACLAEVTIPSSFWPSMDNESQKQHKTTNAKVFYAITHSSHCSDSSFISTTDSNNDLKYLSEVSLVPFVGRYDEVTNDNVVTILVPQEPVYPNSKIYIPVKFTYNSEYPIASFSLRVRVKSGLKVLGAQLSHPNSLWQLSVELNPKQTTAIVTAFLRDFDVQMDSESVPQELVISQEVYSWLIEVEEDIDMNENGRIVWQLLYVTDSSVGVKQDFDKESVKLSSRLDIQKDNVLDVLAITKSNQLLNTALLTGRQVSQSMRIYLVSASGRVSDVTLQSSCHSADESILKVSPSCTSVYLDGSEVRGDQNATVLIKYGGDSYYRNFVVWRPELPIDIRIEDNKLSQIKNWKTNIRHRQSSHPNEEEFQTIDESNDMKNTGCRLRFQQTKVELYTKFFSIDHNSGREASLLSRRVSIRVTKLLMHFIRVTDPKVLTLRANIIEGLNEGRAEVQVISPITGQLMGTKEIKVSAEKETITHLEVKVVTGLELQVKPYSALSNVWMARTTLLDRLTTQYQEGLIDVKIHFSDETTVQLSDISSSDYNLSIDTFDGAVALPPNTGPYPRVIAISPGRGQLLYLSLELANGCQRKRTQTLAMKYVNINVDFSPSNLQNDAFNYRKTNGFILNRNNQTNVDLQYINSKEKVKSNEYIVIGRSSARNPDVNMANIEVGIYSFFSIFAIAIIIVGVLYRIFSRVKTPSDAITTTRIGPITSSNRPVVANANEWVWLGRATLERNSVRCKTRTLEPERDLNGNPIENKRHSESNSKRLSTLSYPGSEISIRITTNPNIVENIDETEEDVLFSQPKVSNRTTSKQNHCSAQPPIPEHRTQLIQSHTQSYSKPPPVPPHLSQRHLKGKRGMTVSPRPPPVPLHRNRMTKRLSDTPAIAQDLRVDLSESNSNKTNCKQLNEKLNYNQLIKYFDSLKESNA